MPQEIKAVIEKLSLKKCYNKRSQKKACKCSEEQKEFLSNFKSGVKKSSSRAHALKQVELSLFGISQELVSLSNLPQFNSDMDLGNICSIKNLNIDKEKYPNCNRASEIENIRNRFSKEINSYYTFSSNNESALTNTFKRNKNKCSINDKDLLKMNFEMIQAEFVPVIELLKSSSKETMKEAFYEIIAEANNEDRALLQAKYQNILLNPLAKSIFFSKENYSKLKSANFSSESVQNMLYSKETFDSLREEISTKCNTLFETTQKILCEDFGEQPEIYSDFDSTKRQIRSQIKMDQSSDLSVIIQANKDIEFYCKTIESNSSEKYPMDIAVDSLKSTIPESLNNSNSIGRGASKIYTLLDQQAEFICKEREAAGTPAGLALRIEEKGCNGDNVSQDCTLLKTIGAIYKDEIAKPGATFADIFSPVEKEKPPLIKAFLGEQIAAPEVAKAQEEHQNAQEELRTQSTGSGSGEARPLDGVQIPSTQELAGNSEGRRRPTNAGQTRSVISAGQNDGVTSSQERRDNMRELYGELSRRLKRVNDREIASMQREVTNLKGEVANLDSRPTPLTDTLRSSLSGDSVSDYVSFQNAEPDYDEFAANDVGPVNYIDPTGSEFKEDDPNSPEARAAGANKALLDMAAAQGFDVGPGVGTTRSGGKTPPQATVNFDTYDNATLILGSEDLDDVLNGLTSDESGNKEKFLQVLNSEEKNSFYIQSELNENHIVRVVKDENGNFKVLRHGPHANGSISYDNFLSSIKTSLSGKFAKVDSLVDFLSGKVEEVKRPSASETLGEIFR